MRPLKLRMEYTHIHIWELLGRKKRCRDQWWIIKRIRGLGRRRRRIEKGRDRNKMNLGQKKRNHEEERDGSFPCRQKTAAKALFNKIVPLCILPNLPGFYRYLLLYFFVSCPPWKWWSFPSFHLSFFVSAYALLFLYIWVFLVTYSTQLIIFFLNHFYHITYLVSYIICCVMLFIFWWIV